jgi:hypothetical protein
MAPSNHQDLSLVLVEDFRKQPYAGLSYSWGDNAKLKLSTENYDDLRSRVLLASLPRTMQDVVKVCRRMSVRYLSIDAPCIIQESGEDFTREIARMGSIYAGALVTVAAGDSTDCNSGCFRERFLLSRQHCVLDSNDHAIRFRRTPRPMFRHLFRLENCPLNTRAWLHQERMLSSRNLHFTRNEVIWECRAWKQCYDLLRLLQWSLRLIDKLIRRNFCRRCCICGHSTFKVFSSAFSGSTLPVITVQLYSVMQMTSRVPWRVLLN